MQHQQHELGVEARVFVERRVDAVLDLGRKLRAVGTGERIDAPIMQ